MKLFITGGMGFVGSNLSRKFLEKGHTITVIERNLKNRPAPAEGVSVIEGDASQPGPWQDICAEHDTIINLAGPSIFTRWTKKKKEAIYSRVKITENISRALSKRKGKKTTLISTSAVGYYGFHDDETIDEETPPGNDFLAGVCKDWEEAALKARDHGARVVICRFGVILGENGGALQLLKKIYKLHIGSRLGSGSQWFSWIHEKDLASIFMYLLENKNISGPVNCTAPHAVTNREFTKKLNKALGTFSIFPPAPAFVLKIILGEFGDFLLKGQRAIPGVLERQGFAFTFPELGSALADIFPAPK